MKLRRYALLLLALFLVALVGVLYLKTRPAPILTVMTWPGAYGRAQATAQMHPYAAAKNVDVRTALWDGDLAEVAAMVKNRAYKADVIDFELPTAVKACNQHLLERIDASVLPPGKDGTPASRDFVAGAIGPCWVGGMVYSQVMVYAPDLKQTPATLADFFDRQGITIESLHSSRYRAMQTGAEMFTAQVTVGIPANMHIAALRDDFMEFCDHLNLDAIMDPMKF